MLSQIKTTNIDIGHCETYYEINLRQQKFGQNSVWKRVQKNNEKAPQIVKRLSFVYSCDTTEEEIGKKGSNEAIRFFCLSFKKRESNNVGPLILDHIKNHTEGINKYLMRDKPCQDDLANKITDDTNQAFGGFDVIWNNCLN